MQPLQPSHRRGLDRRRGGQAVVTIVAVAALLAGLVGLRSVRAQDDAEFEGVTILAFGGGAPSVAPESQLVLRQISFEPGAALPPHSHPGAVTILVARGELAYTLLAGEAAVQRAAVDGEAGAVEPLVLDEATVLGAGDSIFLEGTVTQVVNTGDEAAVVWASSLLAEGEPFLIEESVEEPDAEEEEAEPDSTPEDEEEETEEPEVETVRVTLDEFSIRLSSELPAGETTFAITNRGAVTHSFAIVGEGVEAALERPLGPGDTAELTVDLPAGTYQIICPVANHDALGMTRELVVGDAEAEDGGDEAEDEDGGDDEADEGGEEADADAPAPVAGVIQIAGFLFGPADVEVAVGTTVTWTNFDTATHTVTASDGSFDSGPIESGASFSFAFEEAGEFAYVCSLHSNMVGSVTVTE